MEEKVSPSTFKHVYATTILGLFNQYWHHWVIVVIYKGTLRPNKVLHSFTSPYQSFFTFWYLLQYPLILIFFLFITMSLLSDLINLNLSESTEKIIAEYIWWASLSNTTRTGYHAISYHLSHVEETGDSVLFFKSLTKECYCSTNVIMNQQPLYSYYTVLSGSWYVLCWVILWEHCFLSHVVPSNTYKKRWLF